MSLKTSFLEPDHTTSFASHCTWETNLMPNKHGHKAYHRAPQSGDRSEWSNKIIYLRNYIYIYIYISQKNCPFLFLTMFKTQTNLNLVGDFETTSKIRRGCKKETYTNFVQTYF